MAIYFKSETPEKLLTAFKKAIDNGKVNTWSYDTDGDFTHIPDQWADRAYLRPEIRKEALVLGFLVKKSEKEKRIVYGVYQGRFIESMLIHGYKLFSTARATSLLTNSDVIF